MYVPCACRRLSGQERAMERAPAFNVPPASSGSRSPSSPFTSSASCSATRRTTGCCSPLPSSRRVTGRSPSSFRAAIGGALLVAGHLCLPARRLRPPRSSTSSGWRASAARWRGASGARASLLLSLISAVAGAGLHYVFHMADEGLVIGASGAVSGMMAAAARFAFSPGGPLAGGQAAGRLPHPGRAAGRSSRARARSASSSSGSP